MDNCFIEEPKGKKAVMVPTCPYAKKHHKTLKEGTVDSWEFDDCELRFWANKPLDKWLWAKENCPHFEEIFDAFWEAYTDWVYKEIK